MTDHGAGWFWAWALGIPATSKQQAAAKSFLAWATSKDYVKLVGETDGWISAPPGTRASTYANPDYIKAAPFAEMVKNAILSADITQPDEGPRALHGHSVRRDSRVPGDGHAGRPVHRRRAGAGR